MSLKKIAVTDLFLIFLAIIIKLCNMFNIFVNVHTTLQSTSSRPITEVKQRWARLVPGWVTAWEHRVMLTFFFFYFMQPELCSLQRFGSF